MLSISQADRRIVAIAKLYLIRDPSPSNTKMDLDIKRTILDPNVLKLLMSKSIFVFEVLSKQCETFWWCCFDCAYVYQVRLCSDCTDVSLFRLYRCFFRWIVLVPYRVENFFKILYYVVEGKYSTLATQFCQFSMSTPTFVQWFCLQN